MEWIATFIGKQFFVSHIFGSNLILTKFYQVFYVRYNASLIFHIDKILAFVRRKFCNVGFRQQKLFDG